jgi:hypothetical protein
MQFTESEIFAHFCVMLFHVTLLEWDMFLQNFGDIFAMRQCKIIANEYSLLATYMSQAYIDLYIVRYMFWPMRWLLSDILKKNTTSKNVVNYFYFCNMFWLVIGDHQVGVQYK